MMIPEETIQKLFGAVQTLRDAMPFIITMIEAVDPAAIPELELTEAVLSKVFEAVAKLRSLHDVDSAKPALAAATAAAAQLQLNLK